MYNVRKKLLALTLQTTAWLFNGNIVQLLKFTEQGLRDAVIYALHIIDKLL